MALTPEELAELDGNLNDVMWRLSNLYKIIIKGEDEDDILVIQFKPNRAQRRLIARLHHRNIILKARQLGFTTLICILWLDTALFSKNPMRCGIIAQDREAAEAIFRDKVKFAYDNLPDELRARMPLERDSASELLFAHNKSSIRVATSMRSGTIHRLHVSEFGKICAKNPEKAREVVTGSIPAVPSSGILVIESTAEGQDGEFYKMTQRAMALQQQGAKLSAKDYRFHFFAWWEAPEYEMDPDGVIFTDADREYFSKTEGLTGRELSDRKRAWYVATRESDFSGEAPLMWQEYPSTPEEAFQISTEGCYYATQLATARKTGRILRIPKAPVPVNTFWDVGRGDMSTIWFHQRVLMEDRFIRYYEASGEDLDHYVVELLRHGYVFGTHYLPHDAEHKRLGKNPDTNQSIKEMLEELLPGHRFEVVPRVTSIGSGIQSTRAAFASAHFDEVDCRQGVIRLANYRKKWDKARGCWHEEPLHDDNSHGADAYRQWGQLVGAGEIFKGRAAASAGLKRRGSSWAR